MATSTARQRWRPAGDGTVFKLTAAGTFTTLHAFDCGTEGCAPQSPASSRPATATFYGTARSAAQEGAGVVFRLVGRLSR